jgi:hypothetical protein
MPGIFADRADRRRASVGLSANAEQLGEHKHGVRLSADVLSSVRLEVEIEARHAAAERSPVVPSAVQRLDD